MKPRRFIKFCGLRDTDSINFAQDAGCDALGFVFVRESKRYIDVETYKTLIPSISPLILKVALFANNQKDEIDQIVKLRSFNVIQFHGEETNDFCRQWQIPFWKAVPMLDNIDIEEYTEKFPDACGFVLDHFGTNSMAGSGKAFDWSSLPQVRKYNWILAGGLNPNNIAQAVKESGLNHFDVSSGIEGLPGKKSKTKMNEFIQNLNDIK